MMLSVLTTSMVNANLFAYCGNNAVNMVDEDGYLPKFWNILISKDLISYFQLILKKIKVNIMKSFSFKKAEIKMAIIYVYLVKTFKINELQACAILGNIVVETGYTYSGNILQGSNVENPRYIYNSYDSRGWGILQWTYKTRKEALYRFTKAYIKKTGYNILNIGDLYIQLEYFNWKKSNLCKNEWKKFLNAYTLEEMVVSFCDDYERAGISHMKKRIDKAYRIASILKIKVNK